MQLRMGPCRDWVLVWPFLLNFCCPAGLEQGGGGCHRITGCSCECVVESNSEDREETPSPSITWEAVSDVCSLVP